MKEQNKRTKNSIWRICLILTVMLTVSLLSVDAAFAKDKNTFRLLKPNKWTMTLDKCLNKYSKKQKGYIYTYYKINIPADGVVTFSIKGQSKKDYLYCVQIWSNKKRMLRGGDGGNYEEVLDFNEPIVLKKGTYYITWTDCSKARSRIRYSYHKISYQGNETMEKAKPLRAGKKIYISQTERNHASRWYKLDLKTAKRINLYTSDDTSATVLTLYDQNGQQVDFTCKYVEQTCSRVMVRHWTRKVCPAGVYYLKMEAWKTGEGYIARRSKVSYGYAVDFKWE